MKFIFNHLLIRMLSLVLQRLILIDEQVKNIDRFKYKIEKEDLQDICNLAKKIIKNKQQIYKALGAVMKVQPIIILEEQLLFLVNLRKLFVLSLQEYQNMIQGAFKVKIDKDIIADLQEGYQLGTL